MQTTKLVLSQDIDQDLLNKIKEVIPEWEVIAGKEREVWESHIKDAEVIAGWKQEMSKLLTEESNLRWLQTWSAGVDNLPLEELASRKIQVSSANGVHAFPISETIFAMMLGLTRKIHAYARNQKSKTWHNAGLKLELHGKTIGIIGTGAIGKETAKIAKAFGMTVLGVRHSRKKEDFVDEMFKIEQLTEILPRCDYVVITLPLTNETRHLFGATQFNAMKPSSFFINIGRGEIVVEEALIQALQEQNIAGAGLDVFEKEPLDKKSPLWELENVILTPHTAGATEHYNQRLIEDIFIPNLLSYINEGKPNINVVDYKKGY
jgi:phosphoglycerate dehydrogenase-like enzyme